METEKYTEIILLYERYNEERQRFSEQKAAEYRRLRPFRRVVVFLFLLIDIAIVCVLFHVCLIYEFLDFFESVVCAIPNLIISSFVLCFILGNIDERIVEGSLADIRRNYFPIEEHLMFRLFELIGWRNIWDVLDMDRNEYESILEARDPQNDDYNKIVKLCNIQKEIQKAHEDYHRYARNGMWMG